MLAETRVAPLHSWMPTYEATDGDVAAEIGELVGLTPDADQRMLLDAIFARPTEATATPSAFEVCIVGPRQNIKTSTLMIAALTDLFVMGVRKHVWTAHLFPTAQESFQDMVRRIENVDALRKRCMRPSTANGEEAIRTLDGRRIEFKARSTGNGRGLTGDRLTLDEWLFGRSTDLGSFMPIMATIPDAQVRYGSSAGLLRSDALRALRDRGRRGGDPGLGYFEWGAPLTACASDTCSHQWGVAVGCALDREDLWALSNVALGRRITIEIMRSFRRALPWREFAREFLTWWEDPAGAAEVKVTAETWSDLADERSTMVGQPSAWVVDVTPDQARASIGTSGVRADGRAHLELVRNDAGTGWVVDDLDVLTANTSLRRVHLDASGPARSLIQPLEARGIEVVPVSAGDHASACGHLVATAAQDGLRHLDHHEVNAALQGASTRALGDGGWAWARRTSSVDISPLVALTIALWAMGATEAEPRIRWL